MSEATFGQLSKEMKRLGILHGRNPGRYMARLFFNLGMMGLCAYLMPYTRDSWPLLLLDATIWAFFTVQCVVIAHDAMHEQVFENKRANEILALLLWNLVIGLSSSWFFGYHAKHHRTSNAIGEDPNLESPFYLPGRDPIESLTGRKKWFAKYQAFFFMPFLVLSGGDFAGRAFRSLAAMKKNGEFFIEVLLILIRWASFVTIAIYVLGVAKAMVFVFWAIVVQGFYGGLVFATNHVGMRLIGVDEKVDYFTHQVTTSRNMTPHFFNNFVFQGLNYQIEHHVFPTIGYYRLKEARAMLREHCAKVGLPYHEVGFGRTIFEMLSYLHQAGAPLRTPAGKGAPYENQVSQVPTDDSGLTGPGNDPIARA